MVVYGLLAATAFVAAFIQGLSGFAFGMVFLSIIPHFMPYTQAIVLTSLVAVVLSGSNAWHYRKSVLWRLLPAAMVPYIVMTRIGIYIVASTADTSVWRKLLGIFFVAWATYSLLRKGEIHLAPTIINGILWGALGGTLGGLFGTAPIMAFYFLAVTNDKNSYMGCMQTFFFIGTVFDILFRAQSGMMSVIVCQMAVFALVFALAGFRTGRLILQKITLPQLQRLVYALIGVCGLSLLW